MSATWSLTRATLHQFASPVTKQKSLLFLAICFSFLQNAEMADPPTEPPPAYYVFPNQEKEITPTFMMMLVLISILGLVFFGACIAGVAILLNRRGDSGGSPEVMVVN